MAVAFEFKLRQTFMLVVTRKPRYVGGRRGILQGTWRTTVLFPHARPAGDIVGEQTVVLW